MGQNDRKVVVGIVRPDEILLQVSASLHRQRHFPVGIHDVHFRDRRETVILGRFQVGLRIGPPAAVRSVALYDRSPDPPHQISDQRRTQVIIVAGLARRKLDGDLACRLAAQRLVNLHEILGRNLLEHINLGQLFRALLPSAAGPRRRQCRRHYRHNHTNNLFHLSFLLPASRRTNVSSSSGFPGHDTKLRKNFFLTADKTQNYLSRQRIVTQFRSSSASRDYDPHAVCISTSALEPSAGSDGSRRPPAPIPIRPFLTHSGSIGARPARAERLFLS